MAHDVRFIIAGQHVDADAPLGVEGDKAHLESTSATIVEDQCLTFYLYLRLNPNSTEDTYTWIVDIVP